MEGKTGKIWGLAGQPHALIFRAGKKLYDMPLENGLEVRKPTAEERAEAPEDIPKTVSYGDDGKSYLTLFGLFMFPDRGLAAIYGAGWKDDFRQLLGVVNSP